MTLTSYFDDFVGYSITGAITAFCLHPLDVLKTRFQFSNDIFGLKDYKSLKIIRSVGTIYANEGIRGFYKGVFPAVIRDSYFIPIRFILYEPLRAQLQPYDQFNQTISIPFVSGCISSLVASALSHPLDTIKVRLMSSETKMSLFQAIRRNPIYSGYLINTCRLALLNGLFFDHYSDITEYLCIPTPHHPQLLIDTVDYSNFIRIILESSCWVSLVLCPLDMVRIRLMNQTPIVIEPNSLQKRYFFTSSLDTVLHIYLMNETFTEFYTGFRIVWLRYAMMFSMHILLYQQIRPYCNNIVDRLCQFTKDSWIKAEIENMIRTTITKL